MSDKKSTTLTLKAQCPERTQKFVSVVAEALEAFEDNIGSLEKKHQKTTTAKCKEEPEPEPEPSATKKQKQSPTPSVDKDEPTPSPDTLSYPKASNSFVPYNSHTVLYTPMLCYIFRSLFIRAV